jgi:hypothetical protein
MTFQINACRGLPWMSCLLLISILFSGLAGLQGCGSFETRPAPPHYLIITGKGRADPLEFLPPAELESLNRAWVRFETSRPYDPSIENPTIRASLARASLRRFALRNLGEAVLKLKDSKGIPIGETVYAKRERIDDLENLLESSATLNWTPDMHACRLVVSMPYKVLEDHLDLQLDAGEDLLDRLDKSQKDAFQQRSRDIAINLAKRDLESRLREIVHKDGRSLGEMMDAKPGSARKISTKIWLLEPDEIAFDDDLTCNVTLFFDRNPVIKELMQ